VVLVPEGWLQASSSSGRGPSWALGGARDWRPEERLRAAEEALELDTLATPDIAGNFRRRIDPQASQVAVFNAGMALQAMAYEMQATKAGASNAVWGMGEDSWTETAKGARGFLRLVRHMRFYGLDGAPPSPPMVLVAKRGRA
jgi:hypothetical protein